MTASAFLRSQMQEMADRGWDVHLACAPDDGTDAWVSLQDMSSITLHPIPMQRRPSPLHDISSIRAWIRLIRTTQPDLVVASTPKAGLVAGVAAWFCKVRTRVFHLRGLRSEGLRGAAAGFMRNLERLSIKVSTHVLVDSASLRDELNQLGLDPLRKGRVLGRGSCCGVNIHHYRPPTGHERSQSREALSIQDGEFVFGFVGRITRDKGVSELLSAFEELSSKYPRLRLILIGPLEDSSILSPLNSSESPNKITYVGALADPRSAYWGLDLFVLPSYREGFPIANLEAQACGVPVVTTTATGCRDSIEPETTGLLVPPHDAKSLRLALEVAIQDQRRLEKWRVNARQFIEANFDSRTVNERFVAYLESLVATG